MDSSRIVRAAVVALGMVVAAPAWAQPAKQVAAAPPAEADVARALSGAVAAWDRSCAHADALGLCVTRTKTTSANYCTGAYVRIRNQRKRHAARKAATALARALALYDRVDPAVKSKLGARAAAAAMRQGDAAVEAMLAQPFPTNIDFPAQGSARKKASMKIFQAWLKHIQIQSNELRDRYTAAAAMGDPAMRAVAQARAMAARSALADVLEMGYVPHSVRTGSYAMDTLAAYCDALAAQATPLRPPPPPASPTPAP